MDTGDVDEVARVLDSCIARVRWRLRPAARRRLETDILALFTGLRPVVMVDYGGKMPELQQHLCSLMQLAHKDLFTFSSLKVMVIEDMIYLINVRGLAELALSTVKMERELLFVNLEEDRPKILLQREKNIAAEELLSVQKLFLSVFSEDEGNKCSSTAGSSSLEDQNRDALKCRAGDFFSSSEHGSFQSSDCIDLSSCLKGTQVTIPTLNGWLLGYPAVYLFGKNHVKDAIYNLSTKPLHLYKIVVSRSKTCGKISSDEELMSFSVPKELSMGGKEEPWVEAFLARINIKFERCKHVWTYLRLEVNECHPQAVVL